MLIKWWWRFHTENQVIWRKVICSIHGPLGGLNDNSSVRPNSGPWYHIAKIKDDLLKININLDNIFKIKLGDGQSTSFWNDIWIGDMPLVVSFPRLHRLDINPDCLICDRNPIARASLSALATTSDVTHHFVQLTNNGSMSPYLPPGWECTIDTSRRFSVKGMRSFITSMSHSISSTATLWNKVVPLKININTWRVLNGRMATRANLDRRGVDLDSVRCPICDDAVETEKHLFVDCKIARDTWINVLNWWRIPITTFQSVQDVFQLADESPLEAKISRFFDAVIQTTIWSLWRFRNNVIFSRKKPAKDLFFNDIKILSFNWIVSRCRETFLNLIEWFNHPCNALSAPCNFV
ncbi:RNA-directed DNA polymerase, eukaryota, reverse transcriptase zinc-binding domain protein [Tanacetum coccineum]